MQQIQKERYRHRGSHCSHCEALEIYDDVTTVTEPISDRELDESVDTLLDEIDAVLLS